MTARAGSLSCSDRGRPGRLMIMSGRDARGPNMSRPEAGDPEDLERLR